MQTEKLYLRACNKYIYECKYIVIWYEQIILQNLFIQKKKTGVFDGLTLNNKLTLIIFFLTVYIYAGVSN